MARFHVVSFADPSAALRAARRLREEGFHVVDAWSPMPIHGIEEVLEIPETRLPWGTLAGGLVGLAAALTFQIWTHAVDWPLVIGGKSYLALPALVPVSFETTVLLAAACTVGGLFLRARLRPRSTLRPDEVPDARITDDLFALVVAEESGAHDPARFSALLESRAPVLVRENWRVE